MSVCGLDICRYKTLFVFVYSGCTVAGQAALWHTIFIIFHIINTVYFGCQNMLLPPQLTPSLSHSGLHGLVAKTHSPSSFITGHL
jgi:hypothetical protein